MTPLLYQLYQQRPDLFTEEEVDKLEEEAKRQGTEFQRNLEASPFNLINTVKTGFAGFVEGLTTLPADKWMNAEPKNTAEKIAYSIGSLMGFVGWIPSPTGIMSKLGLSSFLKAIGYGKKADVIAKTAKLGVHFRSPVMMAADAVMGVLNKTGLEAGLNAAKFLNEGKGLIAKDAIQGGLHLGVASAIGAAPVYDLSWEAFTDNRMQGFLSGAIFGAGNRFIGNVFTRGGLADLTQQTTGRTVQDILKLHKTDKAGAFELLKQADKTNKLARMLSSAIVFGMPSTMSGQPIELQVYEYLLNAYFGGRELSVGQREALKFSAPYQQAGKSHLLIRPEKLPGFKDLSPEAKDELKVQGEIEYGGWNHNAEMSNTYRSVLSGLKGTEGYQELMDRIDQEQSLSQAEKERFKVTAVSEKAVNEALRQGKDASEAYEEAKDVVVQQFQERDFYKIFKAVYPEKTPADFDNAVYEIQNRFDDIKSTMEQYGLSNAWTDPIREITDAIANKKGTLQSQAAERLDLQKEVTQFAGEFLKTRTMDRDTFAEEVKKKFGVEIDEDVKNAVTKIYNQLQQAVPIQSYSWVEGKVQHSSEIDMKGMQRKVNWYPQPEISKLYGDDVGVLSTYEGKINSTWNQMTRDWNEKDGELPVYQAIEEGRLNETDIIIDLFKEGKSVISGVKDKSDILFRDIRASQEEVNSIADFLSTAMDKSPEGTNQFFFQLGKNRFYRGAKRKGISIEQADKIYNTIVANNAKWLVEWNFGKDYDVKTGLSRMLLEPKKYLSQTNEIVKRMQVWADKSTRLPKDVMQKLTGQEKFNFAILATAKSGETFPWQNDTYKYNREDGTMGVLHEAHQDGGVIIRDDIFDAMMEASGNKKDGTTAKGVHIFGDDPELGGFIGKLAWHRATPEMSEQMKREGVDGFHLDTTAKQRGNRELSKWTVDKGEFKMLSKHIYQADWNTLTIGGIVEDMGKLNKGVKLISQLQTNIDPGRRDVQQAIMDYTSNMFQGTLKGREAWERYEKSKSDKDLEELDFETDLSIGQKFEILKKNDNSKSWKRVINEILKTEPDETDELFEEDGQSELQRWAEMGGQARRIIESGVEITPEMLMLPELRGYYKTALHNWMIGNIVTPKVKYGWKGTFKVYEPILAERLKVQPGEIYLDGGLKKALTRYKGEEMTLEKALELSQKAGKDLEILAVRVPMDSASGARVLKLKGFNGDKGGGFYVHPEEYANMGGADNDIDSGHLYFELPKEVMDFYKSKRDQWYRTKNNVRVFREQKVMKELLEENSADLYRFDPLSNLYSNKNAYMGKTNLGRFLSLGKRLKLLMHTNGRNGKINIGGQEYKINQDGDIEFINRELVNYSADAADGIELKSFKKIQKYITETMFGSKINLRDDKTYAELMEYDAIRRGRRPNGNRIDLDEVIGTLQNLGEYDNVVYKKMKHFAGQIQGKGSLWEGVVPVNTRGLMFTFKNMHGAYLEGRDKPANERTPRQADAVEFYEKLIKYVGRDQLGFSPEKYPRLKDVEVNGRRLGEEGADELIANDLLALTDAIDTIAKGQRLSNIVDGDKSVREILKKVTDWRKRLWEAAGRRNEAEDKRLARPVYANVKKEVLKEARDYAAELGETDDKGLKRDYLEALLYSVVEPKTEVDAAIRRILKQEVAEASPEKKAELEERYKALTKSYLATQTRNVFASSDLISSKTVKDRINTFRSLIREAKKSTFLDSKEEQKISPDNPLGKVYQEKKGHAIVDNKPQEITLKAERLRQAMLDTKKITEPKVDAVSERVKDFLMKNRTAFGQFEDLYASWANENLGSYKTLSTATEPEITRFMDEMEAIADVGGDGLKLMKRHWWMLPRSVAQVWKGYDWGIAKKAVPVLTETGEKMMRTVHIPQNRFQKLYETLRIGRVSLDKAISEEEQKYVSGPIKKAWEHIAPEDRIFMEDFAIAYREKKDKKNLEAVADFKRMLPEFRRKYANKKFQIVADGKTQFVTGSQFVRFYDQVLTKVLSDAADNVIIKQPEYDRIQKEYVKDGVMDIYRFFDDLMRDVYSKGYIPMLGINASKLAYNQFVLRKIKFDMGEGKKPMSAFMASYNAHPKLKDKVEREFLKARMQDGKNKKIFQWAAKQPFNFENMPKSFREGYWPRMDFTEAGLKDNLEALREKYKDDPARLEKAMLNMEAYLSDEMLPGGGENKELADMLEQEAITERDMATYMGRGSRHLKNRDYDNQIRGYSKSPTVLPKYTKSLMTEYFDRITALVSNRNVELFMYETKKGKNKIGDENTAYWAGYMRNKIRSAMGGSSLFPKKYIDDPGYKIKGNPFYYLTDDYWARNRHSIVDKYLGVNEGTPEKIMGRRVSRKLAALSNMEAKWSMMSLLAAPKAYLNNILTANINTMVSVGLQNWRKSGNLNYLKTIFVDKNGDNKADSWQKLEEWIDINGGMESFIRAEADLVPEFNTAKGQKLLKEIIDLIKQKKATDYTLGELVKRSGFADTLAVKGAWFMRASERTARRKAWIAHYLKARDIFEATHSSFDIDDPWLIEVANRGVEATQFLYNVVERPDFAATSLGKMFARFQMFMVNSLAWRRDVMKAYDSGIDKKRWERMMTADMMVLGLASMLPYTIFNSSLPPPYNYFQQLTGWLFGDKEAREKAFYGALPYPVNIVQPVLPPSSRALTALVGLASGDVDSFLSYQVWTMFPFGRIVRDSYKAVDNPYLFMEQAFGIPYNTLIRKVAEDKSTGD